MNGDISSAYGDCQQQHYWRSTGGHISVHNMAKKRPPLTQTEREAAKKLKARWLAMAPDKRPTQEEIAELWGEGGSQSLVSQYLNAHIPLNVKAAIRFAGIFDCKPEEILDVPELHGRPAALTTSNVVQLKKAAWYIPGIDSEALGNLPDGEKRELLGMIKEKINQALKANPPEKRSRR